MERDEVRAKVSDYMSDHGLNASDLARRLHSSMTGEDVTRFMNRYTLEAPSAAGPSSPLGRTATVIEVARVTLPDCLDTQDIVDRDRRRRAADQRHAGESR